MIPRRRLGARSAMERLANAARMNRMRTVQYVEPVAAVGHTGLLEKCWDQGLAKIHTGRVLKRRVGKAVAGLKSCLDAKQSSTAAGMVIG